MSVQCAAEASQKFTCPGVTGVAPAFTDAVSVTTLPEATVVTALPPEVTARIVVVAALVCAEAVVHAPHTVMANIRQRAANLPGLRSLLKIKRGLRAGIERQTDQGAEFIGECSCKTVNQITFLLIL
jgi:hypothetical protein